MSPIPASDHNVHFAGPIEIPVGQQSFPLPSFQSGRQEGILGRVESLCRFAGPLRLRPPILLLERGGLAVELWLHIQRNDGQEPPSLPHANARLT